MTNKILSSKSIFSSAESQQLLWWFLIITVSTIIFKLSYLDTIYRGGFSIAIENYLEGDTRLEYMKVVCLMFIRNLAEVAVFLTLLYLFACKLLRIKLGVIIVVSTLIIFLVGGANQLSLLNVRSLLSYDSLMVTIDWMRDNPDVITSYINKRNLFYFTVFVFLSFLPVLVSNSRISTTLFRRFNHLLSSAAVLSIVASLLLYFSIGVFVKANASLKPFDGYWVSVASSFIGGSNPGPLKREIPALEALKSNYFNLAYPERNGEPKQTTSYALPATIGKKHIVIISLETAPQKYYPIVNNPELKNFYQMSKRSIVTDKHFTNSPYTVAATYSMLTGMYVPPEGIPILYGKMAFNGLANVLSEAGYMPSYIDSYYVDWRKGDKQKRAIDSYGFDKVFDRNSYNYEEESSKLSTEFDKALYAEAMSFRKIIESIDEAMASNKKSLVFVDTIMGHFKWKAKKGDEELSGEGKIFKLAGVFDELIGELLVSLRERNLEDDTIIVVTGDHGLRYHEEYYSLGEQDTDIAVGFNVPLMIYSSGLFSEQVALDHVTSHIDLTPTLLELAGVDISQYFFHGENLLNPELKQRTVFMMNQSLKPENSFYRQGNFYTLNHLSGELFVTAYEGNSTKQGTNDLVTTDSTRLQQDTAEIIKNAEASFDDSAAYFLQRYKLLTGIATGQ